jgi:acyl carrier protein
MDACEDEIRRTGLSESAALHASAARLAAQVGEVDQSAARMDELLQPALPTQSSSRIDELPQPGVPLQSSSPPQAAGAPPVAPPPAAAQAGADGNEHREWLLQLIAKKAQVPVGELDLDRPFSEYGMDSVDAVAIAHDVEDRLGLDLDPTMLWNYPTPDALLQFLFPDAPRQPEPQADRQALIEALRREIVSQ